MYLSFRLDKTHSHIYDDLYLRKVQVRTGLPFSLVQLVRCAAVTAVGPRANVGFVISPQLNPTQCGYHRVAGKNPKLAARQLS